MKNKIMLTSAWKLIKVSGIGNSVDTGSRVYETFQPGIFTFQLHLFYQRHLQGEDVTNENLADFQMYYAICSSLSSPKMINRGTVKNLCLYNAKITADMKRSRIVLGRIAKAG